MRPTWAEISCAALRHNYVLLRSRAADNGAEVLSVVKANAYGHGLEICAPVLVEAGAEWLGVSNTEEGVQLRKLLGERSKTRILVMGGAWKGEGEAVLEYRLTPVLWEHYQVDLLEQAARRAGISERGVPVHLEIDTGMSRQGIQLATLQKLLDRLRASSVLRMEGLLTHFSSPDVTSGEGSAQTAEQTGVFCRAALAARHSDLFPEIVHAGQSAVADLGARTIQRLRELARGLGSRMMVRPGLALYGYTLEEQTMDGVRATDFARKLQPVMRWKTRVTSLRDIPDGGVAGYNAAWVAPRASRLALLPVGYADGFPRALSGLNRHGGSELWSVVVRGKPAPVVGRVSMDLLIVDVTDVNGIEVGDEVEILGPGEHDAWAMAKKLGTIPYEVTCGIGARVPRIAVSGS